MNNDARTDVLASSDADELPAMSRADEDRVLAEANDNLIRKRASIQRTQDATAPQPFTAPSSVPVVASVTHIRRTSQASPVKYIGCFCFDCERRGRKPATLKYPGLCGECAAAERSDAATARLALAINSIHAERRWARFDSGLLSERIDPLSWSLSVGGKVQRIGHCLADLRAEMVTLTATPHLVISGKETGVGKTSFAVALVHSVIDASHADMCRDGVEPNPHGEGARMIAAIDMLDPNVCKVANAAPFVLLDDAGQEGRATGFRAAEALMVTGNMLDRRERTSRKRTIVTTYGNRDQWGQWYGGRVVRLYWDMPSAVVIEMWNDR